MGNRANNKIIEFRAGTPPFHYPLGPLPSPVLHRVLYLRQGERVGFLSGMALIAVIVFFSN